MVPQSNTEIVLKVFLYVDKEIYCISVLGENRSAIETMSGILSLFHDRVSLFQSINLSHVWLLPTSKGTDGIANALGFHFDDLMSMFEALNLVKANYTLRDVGKWESILSLRLHWHEKCHVNWCRFAFDSDSKAVSSSIPNDSDSFAILETFLGERQKRGLTGSCRDVSRRH